MGGGYMNGHSHGAVVVLDPVQAERRFTLLEVEQATQGKRLDRIEAGQAALSRRILPRVSTSTSSPQEAVSSGKKAKAATLGMFVLKLAASRAGETVGFILAMSYAMQGGTIITAFRDIVGVLSKAGILG